MSDFSKTLALIGLLTPLGASALGIGEIRTQSSLNQVLRAEIPLVLSGNDRLENIRIRLASPEAFQQAGVERQHGLTQLRFKPLARPDGRHVIQVSSRDAITDPFLDFLVEVDGHRDHPRGPAAEDELGSFEQGVAETAVRDDDDSDHSECVLRAVVAIGGSETIGESVL